MFIRACTLLALGKITRTQAEYLIDLYRRCFIHQPYRLRAPYAVRQAYEEARHYHDRRILANLVRELSAGYVENDVGREPQDA